MRRRPPRSKRTDTLFPYTTLFRAIGMVQHYFASAWVPPEGKVRHNEALRLSNNLYAIRSIESVGSIQPGEHLAVDSNLWVGPQDQKAMSELAPGLELVVDYGWHTTIGRRSCRERVFQYV